MVTEVRRKRFRKMSDQEFEQYLVQKLLEEPERTAKSAQEDPLPEEAAGHMQSITTGLARQIAQFEREEAEKSKAKAPEKEKRRRSAEGAFAMFWRRNTAWKIAGVAICLLTLVLFEPMNGNALRSSNSGNVSINVGEKNIYDSNSKETEDVRTAVGASGGEETVQPEEDVYVIETGAAHNVAEIEQQAWDYFEEHVAPVRFEIAYSNTSAVLFERASFYYSDFAQFEYKFKGQFFEIYIATEKNDITSVLGISGETEEKQSGTVELFDERWPYYRYELGGEAGGQSYLLTAEAKGLVVMVIGEMDKMDFVEIAQSIQFAD